MAHDPTPSAPAAETTPRRTWGMDTYTLRWTVYEHGARISEHDRWLDALAAANEGAPNPWGGAASPRPPINPSSGATP